MKPRIAFLAALWVCFSAGSSLAQYITVAPNPLTGQESYEFHAPEEPWRSTSDEFSDCDILAANPIEGIEPDRNYFNTLNVRPHSSYRYIKYFHAAAIRACLKATQQFGQPHNFYQLGRAQDAAGDREAAIASYERAQQGGHPLAAYNLFVLRYQGAGPEEQAHLRDAFRKAADAGDAWLQTEYAVSLLYGFYGFEKDPTEGFRRLLRLSQQYRDDSYILGQLGYAYWQGIGTEVNYVAAQDLLKRAFDSRYGSWKARPAEWLGGLYEDENNPNRDSREVEFHYTVAGMLGEARGFLNLVYLKEGRSLAFRLRHLMNAIALRDGSQADRIAGLIDFYQNEEPLKLFLDHAGITATGSPLSKAEIAPKLKVWMDLGLNGGTADDPAVLQKAENLPQDDEIMAAIREALYLSQAVAGNPEAMLGYFGEVRARVRDLHENTMFVSRRQGDAEIALARLWSVRAAALGQSTGGAYLHAATAFEYKEGDEPLMSRHGARMMVAWGQHPFGMSPKALFVALDLERTPDLGAERFRLAARWYQYAIIQRRPEAAWHLARIYEAGHLGSHPHKIPMLYDIAAMSDDRSILYKVGKIYAEGNSFMAADRQKAFCTGFYESDFDPFDPDQMKELEEMADGLSAPDFSSVDFSDLRASQELLDGYEQCAFSADYGFVVEDYEKRRF